MKLNVAELRVSSFETSQESVIQLPTLGTNDPTAQTRCDDCPAPTLVDCW